ncbi:tRNA (adenine(37)-N6)-methyltransferase isoform X2 [Denticeps clupeoides]|uniref:tRNA (adenine(37)-N6)-methyltransferase n=2 Tax=Denticeps clupeoides TaxID=299321 RepID=A0AAY4AQC5_9TELE|nr:tRNA (adenine(37)-N6)-methyltransferase isoform X2 [Denticeps clupeoides]
MGSLQALLSGTDQGALQAGACQHTAVDAEHVSLEEGCIQTVPIGFISSCFAVKNGTPRQPTICSVSRATLQIQQSVFNNPDHSLAGLEHYSHVWIIFVFHKNAHLSYKAKVKPPRLNGLRVGVYSTRSPHRPNALGLTLAKLERVVGDTLHLSGVDMIAGTPVLDIKPYIPDYDSPHARRPTDLSESDVASGGGDDKRSGCETSCSSCPDCGDRSEPDSDGECPQPGARVTRSGKKPGMASRPFRSVLSEVKEYLRQGELSGVTTGEGTSGAGNEQTTDVVPEEGDGARLCYGEDAYSTIASWIRRPPASSLEVRFTPSAERELREFVPAGSPVHGKPRFKFLKDGDEAAAAILAVLSADPRSAYRRARCRDRLFFFTMDTADITCWFGEGFAEVLRVQPVKTS